MATRLDTRFFFLIFDTIPQGIFTVDETGRITSFNRAAQEMMGYTENEVLGRMCREVFRADMCEHNCPLKRSIATGERTEAWEVTVTARDGRQLPVAISTAALVEGGTVIGGVEMFRDVSTETTLKKQLFSTYGFEDILTKSAAMKSVLEMLPLVANSQSTVLIEGDSGTGKELVARAIHNFGPRRHRPFVALNCAALPDTLLESELFGYKRGAFTDAKKDKPGRFARAEKGTLFLDEVGDLSPAIQAKLLRVLQEKTYEPLGSTQPVRADVRIIAATNRNLAKEVQRKRFRQDLYFRLNVVKIPLPPLSERREDIPLLVHHFIKRFNALQGRRIARCSERVMAALMSYPFPGNVRELENAIEHAFVVCGGDTIQMEDLPPHILSAASESTRPVPAAFRPLEQAEAEVIRSLLERHGGNRKRAAGEMGVSRNTLWRKMRRYGL
ncbi:MAG: sigma 54-interacting transcriptional regulator [bacterium]